MSELMNLAYVRTGPRTGVLDAIARHPDATPWILWNQHVQTDGPMVSAMAMIWLYELVVGQYWMHGPHPLGEFVRCRRDPRLGERPRFGYVEENGRYPASYEVISELVDAAVELFESCAYDFAEVGDYDGGPRITITFVDEAVADAVGLPCPGDTTSDGNTFGAGYPLRVYPHDAGFVRDELDAIPNLYKSVATLPLRGKYEPSSEAVFVEDASIVVVSNTDGTIMAYSTETFEEVWRASAGFTSPQMEPEPDRAAVRVFDSAGSAALCLDARTGGGLDASHAQRPVWEHSSPQGRWVAASVALDPYVFGPPINTEIWEGTKHACSMVWWSNDLARIVIEADDRCVIVAAAAREVVARLGSEVGYVCGLTRGGRLLAREVASELQIVDVASGAIVQTQAVGDREITALGWSSDDARFAVGVLSPEAGVWVYACGEGGVPALDGEPERLACTVASDVLDFGHGLALGHAHLVVFGTLGVHAYSLNTGALLWHTGGADPTGACVDDDAGTVTVICMERGPLVFDLDTGEPRAEAQAEARDALPRLSYHNDDMVMVDAFTLGEGSHCGLVFSRDDARVYVFEEARGVVSVWDMHTRAQLRTLGAGDAYTFGFSVSPDERFVATAHAQEIRFLRADSGAVVGCFRHRSRYLLGPPMWSSCGRWVVVAWSKEAYGRSDMGGHFTLHRVG